MRIQVHEPAGIRRFLYPLQVVLPGMSIPTSGFLLLRRASDGFAVPCVAIAVESGVCLDFAVSMAPSESVDFEIVVSEDPPSIPDPFRISHHNSGITLRQERVTMTLGTCFPTSVVYDGVEHLRDPLQFKLNGASAIYGDPNFHLPTMGLSALNECYATYHLPSGAAVKSTTSCRYTCCKTWVAVTHTVESPPPMCELNLSLALAATDQTPTCDFGVGHGTYCKISDTAVVWNTALVDGQAVSWEVGHLSESGSTRIDYRGDEMSPWVWNGGKWFHFIETTKSLAVAVTRIPDGCKRLAAKLSRAGDIDISFKMDEKHHERIEFGVCYHFLNNIPAIAAATNPASILLTPMVEVG